MHVGGVTYFSRETPLGCVEVAIAEQAVHVRDSKDVSRPAFAVGREGWGRFVSFLR
ncbi:DUF397 domain-containing protein [Streptomyces europaeiscabiei]|uniref:DUF397 domain-containing protein n=1 Tax=Streptomyces europaeiscabiei TaxID=146819 RepID=UPI002E0E9B45|nr:DUF397 domain-containing protein [Streptomyces europaeiscabiei]